MHRAVYRSFSKSFYRTCLCGLLVSMTSLSGCMEADDTETIVDADVQPVIINRSVGDLDELIVLPGVPETVKWTVRRPATVEGNPRITVPGPTDYGLVALLRYSQKDYEAILRNSDPHEVITDAIVDRDFYETWAPEEVKAKFGIKMLPGGESVVLTGRPALRPNAFIDLQGSSPLIHGTVFPLGMGYLVVSLHTM